MKNTKKILVSVGIALSLALTFFTSIPSASAYEQNIVVGPDLTLGSTGQGVVVLQGLLSEMGHLNIPVGVPQGYFGTMTQAAVGRYQAARGVAPTAGYFGPASKISMHQDFAMKSWLTLLGW
jgi:peptidoglycan hydrolase-like protein with peptidoglycan-binding domain